MLQEEELKTAALLVFANKQDMEGAMSVTEISEYMSLTDLKTRTWTM
jgi:ADP-ribosylation factor-like protein 1